ncbi:hypothetical protein [Brevundimonas sp.]|uniref:hypothetical protein n=1 Tax=Brevundimonas sp. TaxID=1871086 RepID=UPI0025C5B500|nr:hypothetical protein [Brevundimonas sp.]
MRCAKCEMTRANAKAAGHRDWKKGVCFDCAAFDLDSPEGRAIMADVSDDDDGEAIEP